MTWNNWIKLYFKIVSEERELDYKQKRLLWEKLEECFKVIKGEQSDKSR